MSPHRPRTVERRSILSGVFWTAANSWGVQAVNLAVFVVLARLVEPQAFGLVALAGVFITISGIFADQGLAVAVIQRKEVEPEHLDTAFWLSLALGAALAAVGLAASLPLARAFGQPGLRVVLGLLSLNLLLNGLSTVQTALLSRQFRFKLLAVRSFGATVVGGVVGVAMAFAGFGVYALVAQQIATAVMTAVLVWAVSGWVPRLRYSRRHARDLLSFGWNVLGIRVFDETSRRSDDLLIGLFLGPVALGYYTIAYKIFKILVQMLTKVVSKVALPTFSALQADRARLVAAFGQSIKLSSLLAFPIFVSLGLLAEQVVPVFFGARWAAAVPVMRVLALMGALQALQALVTHVLIAAGKPSWSMRFLLVNTVVTVAAFLLVVNRGIVAVAAAYTVVGYLAFPVYFWMLRRLLGIAPGQFLAQLRTPLLGSAAVVGAILAADWLLAPLGVGIVPLGLKLAAAGAAYVAVVALLEPRMLEQARGLLRRRVSPAPGVAVGGAA